MIDRLKAIIAESKVHPDKVHPEYAYQRAWNDALSFVERKIHEIEKEQEHGSADRS